MNEPLIIQVWKVLAYVHLICPLSKWIGPCIDLYSDDSSERRHISLHPIDISWDCILQLFGIKNALCSAQQAVRVEQALSEGGMVIKGRWCISFAWNHLCH